MSSPQIPTIQSSKAVLNAADTASLLAAILALSPLPTEKIAANIRQVNISISNPAAPTAAVAIIFNP